MVFKQEQMASAAHEHIIEEPEEEYGSKEIKQSLKKTARKIMDRERKEEDEYAWKVFNHTPPIHN